MAGRGPSALAACRSRACPDRCSPSSGTGCTASSPASPAPPPPRQRRPAAAPAPSAPPGLISHIFCRAITPGCGGWSRKPAAALPSSNSSSTSRTSPPSSPPTPGWAASSARSATCWASAATTFQCFGRRLGNPLLRNHHHSRLKRPPLPFPMMLRHQQRPSRRFHARHRRHRLTPKRPAPHPLFFRRVWSNRLRTPIMLRYRNKLAGATRKA